MNRQKAFMHMKFIVIIHFYRVEYKK